MAHLGCTCYKSRLPKASSHVRRRSEPWKWFPPGAHMHVGAGRTEEEGRKLRWEAQVFPHTPGLSRGEQLSLSPLRPPGLRAGNSGGAVGREEAAEEFACGSVAGLWHSGDPQRRLKGWGIWRCSSEWSSRRDAAATVGAEFRVCALGPASWPPSSASLQKRLPGP